jgi:biopolymer transport protein ExbD
MDTGGKSGKEVNVDLNLVPFMDLMSVCIILLLITSVWTQISMIQLGTSIYAKKNDSQPEPPKEDKISLELKVTTGGYVVSINGASVSIGKAAGQYDKRGLLTYLQKVKQRYPQKQDALVFVDNVVPYEELIRGMDVLMMSGFSNLSVGG